MKNTFITKDGKKVSLGDSFKIKCKIERDGIVHNYCVNINYLTPSNANMLVKEGILVEYNIPKHEKITLNDAIALVGRWNLKIPKYDVTVKYLSLMPGYARFSVLLRAFAVLIDRKYPDHINNADVDKYYTIDMSNGRVCEVPKGKVKNFKNFAAFRTLGDIKIATKILRPFMKELWPSE